jgi:hypothetical protein
VLDLSHGTGQERLVRDWGQPELVVLDDRSSLTGLRSADTERWHELHRFLQLQRSFGRTMLLVDHANRHGARRGTSRHDDMLDLVLALRHPRGWTAADGARFSIHVEKARNAYGAALEPIVAELRPVGAGDRWRWEAAPTDRLARAVSLLRDGLDVETMGRQLGISRSQAFRLQQRARQLGWLPGPPAMGRQP